MVTVTRSMIPRLNSAICCLVTVTLLWHIAWGNQASSGPTFTHHNNEQLEEFLKHVNKTSNITHLYSIGQSVQGRELWVLMVGGPNVRDFVPLRPDVKYIGNMHGNEVVSRELLIHLIHHLVSSYGTNSTITRFLNTTRVHIMPSMNPDGNQVAWDYGARGNCFGVTGRLNANGYDLNRNFPDLSEVVTAKRQPETQHIMDWVDEYQFVLSANLHGGAMVANYPYDNYKDNRGIARYSRSRDDALFQHLARVFSYSHHTMHQGHACPRDPEVFPEGITNGAMWYPVAGSMQDYNYGYAGCMELTLEIACCKFPNHTTLPAYWEANRDALLNYLFLVHSGVKGVVRDTLSLMPVQGAEVAVEGKDHPSRTNLHGEFWRLLLPGMYTLRVQAPGYYPNTRYFEVEEGAPTVLYVELTVLQSDPTHSLNPTYSSSIGVSVASVPNINALLASTCIVIIKVLLGFS